MPHVTCQPRRLATSCILESITSKACFVATQLIFPYPSVPDGVTLRSGFVEAMPRQNPRVVKLNAVWLRLSQRIPFLVRLLFAAKAWCHALAKT